MDGNRMGFGMFFLLKRFGRWHKEETLHETCPASSCLSNGSALKRLIFQGTTVSVSNQVVFPHRFRPQLVPAAKEEAPSQNGACHTGGPTGGSQHRVLLLDSLKRKPTNTNYLSVWSMMASPPSGNMLNLFQAVKDRSRTDKMEAGPNGKG